VSEDLLRFSGGFKLKMKPGFRQRGLARGSWSGIESDEKERSRVLMYTSTYVTQKYIYS